MISRCRNGRPERPGRRLVTPERAAKLALWDRFCAEHGVVEVFRYGRDGRPMLRRSAAMEAMVVETVEAVFRRRRPMPKD
jgi:hypothetical protein